MIQEIKREGGNANWEKMLFPVLKNIIFKEMITGMNEMKLVSISLENSNIIRISGNCNLRNH